MVKGWFLRSAGGESHKLRKGRRPGAVNPHIDSHLTTANSIYFLLKALDHETMESSTIFTVNNVAVVMLSGLVGFLLFKEKLSPKNWLGVIMAILSILLVTLA